MIRLLLPLAAGALLWVGVAQAQDKTFTLTVTNQDLQVLSAALDELPRKVSEPVVEKFQKQIMPQMVPPSQPAVDPNMLPKLPAPTNADAKN